MKFLKLFLFTIPVILLIIGVVLIGSLKLVERYPNPLRQGFEQYLSEATGANATIAHLQEVKFFPNFEVTADDVTIHNRANAAMVDVGVKKIDFSIPLSGLLTGAKKFNKFSLENLTVTEDFWAAKAVTVDKADIIVRDGEDQYGSFLVATGKVGGQEARFEAALKAGTYHYEITNTTGFSLTVGEYTLNATLKRNFLDVVLENTVLTRGDEQSTAKDYILVDNGNYNMDSPLFCLFIEKDLAACDKYL